MKHKTLAMRRKAMNNHNKLLKRVRRKGCTFIRRRYGVPVPLPIRWKMWMFAFKKWSKDLLDEETSIKTFLMR